MAAPSYTQSRRLVLGAGLAILAIIALVLYIRGTDGEEVLAVLFFLPVFGAAVVGGIRWGVIMALVATAAYAGLRWDELQFTPGIVLTRILAQGIGYLVFGIAGGWAAGVVGEGITKLDRFDVRDDDSELLNARGVHEQLDGEIARARRYGSSFAVVTVTFPVTGNKKQTRGQVGEIVSDALRTVDHPGRVTIDGQDVVIAVLPETPPEGAQIAGQKIAERLQDEVLHVDTQVAALSLPGDDEEIEQLQAKLEEVVRREHPEAARR